MPPVVVNSGPTTAEFIVSLVIVGILGPALGVLATRWSDRRRFAHERGLKASDDLVARIDDVTAALETLGEACATTRQTYLSLAASDPPTLWPLVRAAEDAVQRARELIARLAMRPHADAEMVKRAQAAAESHSASTRAVRNHLIRAQAASAAVEETVGSEPIEEVIDNIEKGYEETREFTARARVAIGKLLA